MNGTIAWVDITKDFKESVHELKLGELLHDELFGLFEAMSAIEMMDPKMDAGMICNRGMKKAKTLEQSIADGSLQMNNISKKDTILIIDTTLACIVSWLEGHSLAQTVFTNLYLHNPHNITDTALKAFAIIVHKLLEIVRDYVHNALVYEEEDFHGLQYGYHLNPDISEHRAISMLREVEEDIHAQTKFKSQIKDPVHRTEVDDSIALYARIKFVRTLYQSLSLFLQKKDEHHHQNETRSVHNGTVTNGTTRTVDCQRLLLTALDMLTIMQATVNNDETVNVMGFEPLINQRLLPPTFPRYTKIKTRSEALLYFQLMIHRFRILSKIQSIVALHQALDFFIEFSKGSPCLLSRSALQILYIGSSSAFMNPYSNIWKDILKDAAKSFISPPALVYKSLLYSNSQAKMYVETFFAHCMKPFAALLQLCGHNRARQRDKLAHLLDEFATLQDEAERVDTYLHTISLANNWARHHLACFGTWILYHTLRIMIMYLLSGFELELYSVHEYSYIYWYLYEFLYVWLVSALTRADSFLAEQEMVSEMQRVQQMQAQKSSINSSSTSSSTTINGGQINGVNMSNMNNHRKQNRCHRKQRSNQRPYSRDVLYYQALQHMCGGYHKAFLGFRLDSKMSMPHPEFDSERVRYEHRFAPFQNLLTPPPVQYKEYQEFTTVSSTTGYQFFINGFKHFHDARQLLENIQSPDPEVAELVKIAKTNYVVLKLLAGGHKKESTHPPEFIFAHSKHFPIIKLT